MFFGERQLKHGNSRGSEGLPCDSLTHRIYDPGVRANMLLIDSSLLHLTFSVSLARIVCQNRAKNKEFWRLYFLLSST